MDGGIEDRKWQQGDKANFVSLAEHTVKVEHHPYLEVTYRSIEIPDAKLEFTLTRDLMLEAVILLIQNGNINATIRSTTG